MRLIFVRGWVKILPALAYLFCLALPGSCLTTFAKIKSHLCSSYVYDPFALGLRPHALHPGAIQEKEGTKICHLATEVESCLDEVVVDLLKVHRGEGVRGEVAGEVEGL